MLLSDVITCAVASRTTMISNVELLPDRVLIHYWCKQPWSSPDTRGVVDVPYATLDHLPTPPLLAVFQEECRDVSEEGVWISRESAFICLHFAEWQETDDCTMQALIGGPYQAFLENPS